MPKLKRPRGNEASHRNQVKILRVLIEDGAVLQRELPKRTGINNKGLISRELNHGLQAYIDRKSSVLLSDYIKRYAGKNYRGNIITLKDGLPTYRDIWCNFPELQDVVIKAPRVQELLTKAWKNVYEFYEGAPEAEYFKSGLLIPTFFRWHIEKDPPRWIIVKDLDGKKRIERDLSDPQHDIRVAEWMRLATMRMAVELQKAGMKVDGAFEALRPAKVMLDECREDPSSKPEFLAKAADIILGVQKDLYPDLPRDTDWVRLPPPERFTRDVLEGIAARCGAEVRDHEGGYILIVGGREAVKKALKEIAPPAPLSPDGLMEWSCLSLEAMPPFARSEVTLRIIIRKAAFNDYIEGSLTEERKEVLEQLVSEELKEKTIDETKEKHKRYSYVVQSLKSALEVNPLFAEEKTEDLKSLVEESVKELKELSRLLERNDLTVEELDQRLQQINMTFVSFHPLFRHMF